MKKSKFAHVVLTVALFFSTLSVVQASEVKSFTYFTGIGCPHCANVSPTLHDEVNSTDNLLMIEYEIYKEASNAKILSQYSDRFGFSLAIPLTVYEPNVYDLGDSPILKNYKERLLNISSDTIQLEDKSVSWEELSLNDFLGKPKIFGKDRVIVREGSQVLTDEENIKIKEFLLAEDLDEYVVNLSGYKVDSLTVKYPGGEEIYDNGVKIGAWSLMWRGNASAQIVDGSDTEDGSIGTTSEISILKLGALALTDSINPCALSVLLMMLIAITTYHPKDRKQVLFAGLAFVAAVFITYFIYGLLIVRAFDLIQGINSIKDYLYKGLGVVALILGLLEIKDFFFYKPGGIGTEMPMLFRPKVQQILAKVTSPIGAFGLGIFVTLFLLPCTIGPYVILGGMLSYGEFINSLPYLGIYNLIFVLPMIAIIFLVFFGSKNVKQISDWKEKNIRVLHLIIGIIFILLGSSMVLGWF